MTRIDPEASHDARLAAACWRVEAAVRILTVPKEAGDQAAVAAGAPDAGASEPALAHLRELERVLIELSGPLRVPARSRFARA